MKKIPNWIIITIVIALLIASKFIFFAKKDDKAAANKGKATAAVTANYYVAAQQELSNNLSLVGKTGAFNQVDILPEVSGKITGIYFKEGETVNKGALLVKLNDADIQAQLLKVKTQIKLAEQKLNRLKQLLQVKGVSQEEYDTQDNELNVLKAEESFNNAQLAKTSILAPFTGVLGLKKVSEGAFVNANTPIVSLVQLNPLYIEFSVPEKYSQLLRKDQKIDFKLDEDQGVYNLKATVYAVEPMVDEATKSLKVRAVFSATQAIYPGIFVLVQIKLNEVAKAIMVPTQCIIPTLKGQKVIVFKNGEAVENPVKIGFRNDQYIQIIEGLMKGDTVLTTGLLGIKKDSKVKLLKPTH